MTDAPLIWPLRGRDAAAARKERWSRRLPLLPALIFMIAVTQVPFIFTLAISFMNWQAFYPDEIHFAWFENYIQLFQQPQLSGAVVTSISMTAVVVIVSLCLGFVAALLLNNKFRGRAAVRTMMIAPFLMVPVAAALIWKNLILDPNYGLVNGALNWMGSLFGQHWAQPSWVTQYPIESVEVTLIWQWTPFMMLIILAGLQSQSIEVLEAARVDGAGAWRILKSITLPHVRRYVQIATILGSIYILQNFDAVFTLTSGSFDTSNLPYSIYQTFFVGGNYGLASAMGVVTVAGTVLLVTLFVRTVGTFTNRGTR